MSEHQRKPELLVCITKGSEAPKSKDLQFVIWCQGRSETQQSHITAIYRCLTEGRETSDCYPILSEHTNVFFWCAQRGQIALCPQPLPQTEIVAQDREGNADRERNRA